ncbi:hypothetical protein B0H17DRAFT_1129140 [Mycena rosella]|uniref:Uncharacterized protein n=1 Tax=Mycena rosella TaxID=1033263 RepID=A0AAD7GNM7_MYCRO|nr:hypothetical protein B0H17DRAFT_1129140 [Mycena rosella]
MSTFRFAAFAWLGVACPSRRGGTGYRLSEGVKRLTCRRPRLSSHFLGGGVAAPFTSSTGLGRLPTRDGSAVNTGAVPDGETVASRVRSRPDLRRECLGCMASKSRTGSSAARGSRSSITPEKRYRWWYPRNGWRRDEVKERSCWRDQLHCFAPSPRSRGAWLRVDEERGQGAIHLQQDSATWQSDSSHRDSIRDLSAVTVGRQVISHKREAFTFENNDRNHNRYSRQRMLQLAVNYTALVQLHEHSDFGVVEIRATNAAFGEKDHLTVAHFNTSMPGGTRNHTLVITSQSFRVMEMESVSGGTGFGMRMKVGHGEKCRHGGRKKVGVVRSADMERVVHGRKKVKLDEESRPGGVARREVEVGLKERAVEEGVLEERAVVEGTTRREVEFGLEEIAVGEGVWAESSSVEMLFWRTAGPMSRQTKHIDSSTDGQSGTALENGGRWPSLEAAHLCVALGNGNAEY